MDSASAVAKGGGQGAEGDAKRRSETMNRFQAVPTLGGALDLEAEIGLKNGQSNLTAWNEARGLTPDSPDYKTIMNYMTPAQQQKAIKMLGAEKIEEITGKPAGRGGASRTSSGKAASYQEGQTATGPGGQRIVFRNGAWVPAQ